MGTKTRPLVVESLEDARKLAEFLDSYPNPVGIDTETTGCNPRVESPVLRARIWCMTLAWGQPSKQVPSQFHSAFVPVQYLAPLKGWLGNRDKLKVGTNLHGFDYHCFANEGVPLRGFEDTLVMSRQLNPSSPLDEYGGHGLKAWGDRLGYDTAAYDSLTRGPAPDGEAAYKSTSSAENSKGVRVLRVEGALFTKLDWGPHDIALLWDRWPERRQRIVEYATKDARMSLDVWYVLRGRLERTKW